MKWEARAFAGAVALLVVLFLLHWSRIWRHAVDVPFWDEWSYFEPEALPRGLTLSWLWAQHNEHRIAPTKLLAWLLHRTVGLDFAVFQRLGFLIYGGLVLLIGAHLRRLGVPRLLACLLVLPLLSTIAWENHCWGFQTQIHFAWIGLVLGTWGLLTPGRGVRGRLGVSGAALAAVSFSAGFAGCVVLLLTHARRHSARASSLPPRDARALRARWLGQALTLVALILVWAASWERSGGAAQVPSLGVLSSLLSLGFGFDQRSSAGSSSLLALLCLGLSCGPLALVLGWTRARSARALAVATVLATVLLTAVLIGASRGIWGPQYMKSPRYAELMGLLVPYGGAGAWLFGRRLLRGRGSRSWAWLIPLPLIVLAGIGLRDDWNPAPYRAAGELRRASLDVLRSAPEAPEPVRPRAVFLGRDVRPYVERARELRVPFTLK